MQIFKIRKFFCFFLKTFLIQTKTQSADKICGVIAAGEAAAKFAILLFVKNVPEIMSIQKAVYNPPMLTKKTITQTAKIQIDNTLESLIGSGIKQNVVNELQKILISNVTTGGSYAELIDSLRTTLVTDADGNGLVAKNSRLYVENALSQFAGQGNKLIADELNSEWFQYVGNNRTTTREFCEHLTKKEWIHKSEIPTLLTGMIDGHQCEIYEKYGLPKGMIEGTNPDNFIVNKGGWNCNHQLFPVVNKNKVPLILRQAIEIRENIKKLGEIGGRTNTSNMLLMDITGGVATAMYQKIKSLYNENLDNRERLNILKDIVASEGFEKYENNILKFATVNKNDVEFPNNINGARALSNLGYKVYMLPNPMNTKSADFVIVDNNKNLYYTELKTIHGKSQETVINQLNVGKTQADRIILNVSGNISPRDLADGIKDFYLDNQFVKEIKVLKSGKEIRVRLGYVKEKNFTEDFMNRYYKK